MLAATQEKTNLPTFGFYVIFHPAFCLKNLLLGLKHNLSLSLLKTDCVPLCCFSVLTAGKEGKPRVESRKNGPRCTWWNSKWSPERLLKVICGL